MMRGFCVCTHGSAYPLCHYGHKSHMDVLQEFERQFQENRAGNNIENLHTKWSITSMLELTGEGIYLMMMVDTTFSLSLSLVLLALDMHAILTHS